MSDMAKIDMRVPAKLKSHLVEMSAAVSKKTNEKVGASTIILSFLEQSIEDGKLADFLASRYELYTYRVAPRAH